MLDPKLLRQNLDYVAGELSKRGYHLDVEKFQALEEKRKKLQVELQELQHQRKTKSKQIGQAKAQGESVEVALKQVSQLGEQLTQVEDQLDTIQTELQQWQLEIPNLPHESVPVGKTEQDNQVVRHWGEPTAFDFTPQDHVALGESLNMMSFSQAADLACSRFVVLQGPLSQLYHAIIRFMLDLHRRQHGYEEVYVPYIVNSEALYGTGQLPKFAEDQFALKTEKELYLIPTAEVPVTNLVRNKIIDAEQLPLKRVAHSPCFRSEAGSYGKDTRGIIRQHQFEKVELVQIVKPEHSYEALEELTQHAEKVLQLLKLPYRVMSLCSGDIGFAAAKTYDLEVWLPGQNQYREISSCSNTEAFQARRMQARWRTKQEKTTQWLHTLNGSGLAVERTLVAIMENYQDAEGRIVIPEVLRPYMDDEVYIT
jgi:seryl-tRNA synthetase